jgi:hypothetical protein
LNKRLGSISCSFEDKTVHTHIFNYGEYAPVTGLSRLQSITLSDASGASVLPLTFDWSDAAAKVFDEDVPLNSIPGGSDAQIIPIDVRGSGRTDLVVASKQFINNRYVLNLNVHFSDENGDISAIPAPGSGPTDRSFPDQLLALDVDGDGRTDLVRVITLEPCVTWGLT